MSAVSVSNRRKLAERYKKLVDQLLKGLEPSGALDDDLRFLGREYGRVAATGSAPYYLNDYFSMAMEVVDRHGGDYRSVKRLWDRWGDEYLAADEADMKLTMRGYKSPKIPGWEAEYDPLMDSLEYEREEGEVVRTVTFFDFSEVLFGDGVGNWHHGTTELATQRRAPAKGDVGDYRSESDVSRVVKMWSKLRMAQQLNKKDIPDRENLAHLATSADSDFDLVLDSNGQFWILNVGIPVWRGDDDHEDEVMRKWNEYDPEHPVTKEWVVKRISGREGLPKYEFPKIASDADAARELVVAARELAGY